MTSGRAVTDCPATEDYLNVALEEHDPRVASPGITEWAGAHGGVAQVADKTKLNRESLYKMLSERGNPQLRSLNHWPSVDSVARG